MTLEQETGMKFYLAKTDPDTYTIADLERDKTTVWDGVTNPQAANFIGAMKKGDLIFIYHSGGESAVVGLARAESDGRPDPKNAKSKIVDVRYICRLDPPVTLKDVKSSGLFADFLLVRNSRLSTMECPENFVAWMRKKFPKAGF
jgi:predicted RNA-binding protein with PUA-like domain